MTKKDKRYKRPLDNYMEKYKGIFKRVLVYVIAFLICYGMYELYQYLF